MDSQLTKILSTCSVSTRATAQTFFPERFTMPFAEQVPSPNQKNGIRT
jgi:hypothetical protein